MSEMMPWMFSNHMAALVVPMVIFFVVMTLVVRKLIGFGMVLTFLAFALVSGFVISNYDVVRSHSSNGAYPASSQEWKEGFNAFSQQIAALVEGVRSESNENIHNLQLTSEEILRRLEVYQEQHREEMSRLADINDEREDSQGSILSR